MLQFSLVSMAWAAIIYNEITTNYWYEIRIEQLDLSFAFVLFPGSDIHILFEELGILEL